MNEKKNKIQNNKDERIENNNNVLNKKERKKENQQRKNKISLNIERKLEMQRLQRITDKKIILDVYICVNESKLNSVKPEKLSKKKNDQQEQN